MSEDRHMPKPKHIETIGGYRFGIYPTNIDGRYRYRICAASEAAYEARGTQDPEQASRVGFSENRAGGVAVASSADEASPMDDKERVVAEFVMRRIKELACAKKIEFMDTDPFNDNQATSLVTVQGQQTVWEGLLNGMLNDAAIELNASRPWQQHPAFRSDDTGTGKKWATTASRDKPRNYVDLKLDTLAGELEKHFPGNDNSGPRAKAVAKLMVSVDFFRPKKPSPETDERQLKKLATITAILTEALGNENEQAIVNASLALLKLDIQRDSPGQGHAP